MSAQKQVEAPGRLLRWYLWPVPSVSHLRPMSVPDLGPKYTEVRVLYPEPRNRVWKPKDVTVLSFFFFSCPEYFLASQS